MISRMMHLLLFTGLAWSQTKTVAVFDFQNDSLSSNEVSTLMDRLRTDIAQVSDFIVVERHRINDILKEQKIQTNSCFGKCAIEVGKLLGATNVVCGSIGRISLTYTISAIMIDAQTGEIVRSIRYRSDDDNDSLFTSGMREVALEIIREEPQDTLGEERTVMSNLNDNDGPSFAEPLATLWQLDAMKSWGAETGVNTENFIKECYGVPIEYLTKSQGAEVLMYLQFNDMPGHW